MSHLPTPEDTPSDSSRSPETPRPGKPSPGSEGPSSQGPSSRSTRDAPSSARPPGGREDGDRTNTDEKNEGSPAGERQQTPRTPRTASETFVQGSPRASERHEPPLSFQPGDLIAARYEIVEVIGSGGFGRVYRAHDRQLDRSVAIKRARGLTGEVSDRVRGEARAIASLDHPGIVSIYDLVEHGDHDLLIVMESLRGQTLSERITGGGITISEVVDIMLDVGDALQHAHERTLIHNDLKPSNLFIDEGGRVRVLDFGLAIDFAPGDGPTRGGGTPGYMSPEQVRGETHRYDGRVDVWGMGVVAYELLSGVRPFAGSSRTAIEHATLERDPPPLRQVNPRVDDELQRIVGRCLEKRMADRYASVANLLDDLKAWKETADPNGQAIAGERSTGATGLSTRNRSRSRSERKLARGFAPFTEEDAATYLEWVPGPRDRHGIPESLRFWMRWVESDDHETHYPVGVLYGPAGAGKTSYVRAGLFPQLSGSVCKVYVECRPGHLGRRIREIIQTRLNEHAGDSSLREVLGRLRSSRRPPGGFRKFLIVLDQFEVWSQSASLAERRELADALRQCDGHQVRALIVSRDDHWMGVTELLKWLELPLQEARNIASVDLLNVADAVDVLEGLGRESGALPELPSPLSDRQKRFLHVVAEELAQHGRVICIHVVLFAQMMRHTEWDSRQLRLQGGVVGACGTYLEELFSGQTGGYSPEYKRLAPGIREILLELLPDDDDSPQIKTLTLTQIQNLLATSQHSVDAEDCLRVLEDELKLVARWSAERNEKADEPVYGLSHAFLIAPIGRWLTRSQQSTWLGRTRLRLRSVAANWSRRPNPAHLPRFGEYLSFLAAASMDRHAHSETGFLRAATKFHAGRILVSVLGGLAMLLLAAFATYQTQRIRQARRELVVNKVDLVLHGRDDDLLDHIGALQEFGSDGVREMETWATSVEPVRRFRAEIFLQGIRPRSFEPFADHLADVPLELADRLLWIARRAPDAGDVLRRVAGSEAMAITARTKAAILLVQIDEQDHSALAELLMGSSSADDDRTMLLTAGQWRGEVSPWIRLLEEDKRPEVQFHALCVLSQFRPETLRAAEADTAIANLIPAAGAAVGHAVLHLQHRMGITSTATPPPATDQADWRLSAAGLPLIRVGVGQLSYRRPTDRPGYQRKISIQESFWMSAVPVSRSLFDLFEEQVTILPDGRGNEAERPHRSNRDWDSRNDRTLPRLGISHVAAVEFCNWLSRREGLQPAYEYVADPPPLSAVNQIPRPSMPWEEQAEADGYRLPTLAQYEYVLRCGYQTGLPWLQSERIGLQSGVLTDDTKRSQLRPPHAHLPNRMGFFVNDMAYGGWLFQMPGFSRVRQGDERLIRWPYMGRHVHDAGLYVVRPRR